MLRIVNKAVARSLKMAKFEYPILKTLSTFLKMISCQNIELEE